MGGISSGEVEELLLALAGASVVLFLVTLLIVPWLVVKIPEDYFLESRRHGEWLSRQHLFVRHVLIVFKNIAGAVLILLGIIMLVLPGQGIITILVGLILINFPGKYKLERWLVSRKPVLRSINWLRQRAGHRRLVLEKDK